MGLEQFNLTEAKKGVIEEEGVAFCSLFFSTFSNVFTVLKNEKENNSI